ncbi:OmpA family protein [Saccharophagus degradans]|uniref:OmpA family protein n=1 Tax=Saccharophagus degradans TaxID=86304 RepID=A0AAW7X5Y8_9GAMM|nr:OmpA family protein [Saccharophagus degradans]MDO6422161.1 OmpA family protein [Saccharophagus degradans]MDO6607564.1 OmpA family protein [Saccharophagus degradans]
MTNKLKLASSIAVLVSSLSAGVSFADEGDKSIFVTTGKYFYDNDLSIDDATPLTLGAGYEFSDKWGGELSYTYLNSEVENSNVDVTTKHLLLDGLYYLGDAKGDWKPYLVSGIGGRNVDVDGFGDSSSTFVNAGVGIKGLLAENFQVRGDVRALHDLDDSFNDVGVNIGLAYVFGGKAKASKPTVKPAAITPAKPMDSDNDGVANTLDACPATPANVTVDAKGCALDSDNDGVADYQDSCANTAATHKVDAKGCSLSLTETVAINLSIQFDNNSAVVKESYYAEVKRVADFMNQYANTQVSVEGYTDDRGSAAYNKQLSQKRADAVKATLVSQFNIDAARVTATGFGEINPIDTNDTAAGRAANRRVVANVSSEVEKAVTK